MEEFWFGHEGVVTDEKFSMRSSGVKVEVMLRWRRCAVLMLRWRCCPVMMLRWRSCGETVEVVRRWICCCLMMLGWSGCGGGCVL